jgi:hypothetical protein
MTALEKLCDEIGKSTVAVVHFSGAYDLCGRKIEAERLPGRPLLPKSLPISTTKTGLPRRSLRQRRELSMIRAREYR